MLRQYVEVGVERSSQLSRSVRWWRRRLACGWKNTYLIFCGISHLIRFDMGEVVAKKRMKPKRSSRIMLFV